MSQDWIEAAAAKLNERFIAEIGDGPDGAVLSDKEIADILRSHAPPVPQWCERPTCAGWWNYRVGDELRLIYLTSGDAAVNSFWGHISIDWYGPIPFRPGAMK